MRLNPYITRFLMICIFCTVSTAGAQNLKSPWHLISDEQSYDPNYIAPTPPFPANTGTVVYVDAAHNNFHTATGRYKPFADLLRNDGFVVDSFNSTFTAESLTGVKILVISNPVNDVNNPEVNWVSPILSAFTDDEIDAVVNWVHEGGSLLLIADHYPFPGAAELLAERFGFAVDNGYNFDPNYFSDLRDGFFQLPIVIDIQNGTADPNSQETMNQIFAQATTLFIELGAEVNTLSFWASDDPESEPGFAEGDGNLMNHIITQGRPDPALNEAIPYITTFTGHSFSYTEQPDITFSPLLVLGDGTYTVLTEAQDAYFGPDANTSDMNMLHSLLTTGDVPDFVVPTVNSTGMLQAALVEVGEGKVAFFGEAGMFTAQIAADGTTLMGMNNANASHNWQYILNLVRYLDGFLEYVDVSVADRIDNTPSEFTLSQNYPNPFNPTTNITFSLPEYSEVKLEVYDITGKKISTLLNGNLAQGQHTIPFNAGNLANGIYMYRMSVNDLLLTRKMVLIK